MIRNTFFYSIILLALFSCRNQKWEISSNLRNNNYIDTTHTLVLKDSFFIKASITGFNNFIPVAINPTKTKIIIVPSLGSKDFLIYNFLDKSLKAISFKKYVDTVSIKEGIYNIGFYNDSIIVLTIRDKVYLFNHYKSEITSIHKIEKSGNISSYNKSAIVLNEGNNKFFLSQWYSKKSLNGSESDHFFKMSPLSIYNFTNDDIFTINLPSKSIFKENNVGQPVVYFDYYRNQGVFITSPDTLLYTFKIVDLTGHFIYEKVISFNTFFSKDLILNKNDSKLKDIMKTTTQNSQLTGLSHTEKYWVLSYAKGLEDNEYNQMFDYQKDITSRGKAFSLFRPTFLIVFDSLYNSFGSISLPDNIEGVGLYLGNDNLLLKTKTASYYNQDSIPFYICKITQNENY